MTAQAQAATQPLDADLYADLRDLTSTLHLALERFRLDSRIVDLAEKEIPDARQRLSHVLKLTDEAAHRTMDLVEQSGPPAERTAREAGELAESWARFRARSISVGEFRKLLPRMDGFLGAARSDCELVRHNLAEVLLAQGYQDLTGQIIRGVMKLVGEIEAALVELTRISHRHPSAAAAAPESNHGSGPAVPGVDVGAAVVSGQQDVDDLLSGLGM